MGNGTVDKEVGNRIIDIFANRVFETTDSFMLSTNVGRNREEYFYYVQSKRGNARFIYGKTGYSLQLPYMIDLKLSLVAIVNDVSGKIGIFDYSKLDIWDPDAEMPENVVWLHRYLNEYNKYLKYEVFPEWYDFLEVEEITDISLLKNLKIEARKSLLLNDPTVLNANEPGKLIEMQEALIIFAGVKSIKEVCLERLEDFRRKFVVIKSRKSEIINQIESGYASVEQWEIDLANSLSNVLRAKYITVVFKEDSAVCSIKIRPDFVLETLIKEQCFSPWDFKSTAEAYALFSDMKIKGYSTPDCGKDLRCDDIVKITYGKKLLYVRDREVKTNE